MKNISAWGLVIFLIRPYIKFHILLPLLVGVIVDLLYIHGPSTSWYDAATELMTMPHIVPIISIFITYGLITIFGVRKETTPRFNPDNLLAVEDIISQAKHYFALSPLPVREWFSPGIVRYFSILLGRHIQTNPSKGDFDYTRVVVFTSPRRQAFAKAQFIDRDYSLAFGRLHIDSKIPLGVLKPSTLYTILQTLSPEKRQVFVPLPLWVLRNIRRHWLYRVMSPFLRLDFALIDYGNDNKTVLTEPTGCREINELSGDSIKPYVELVNKIKKEIYCNQNEQEKFKASADFMKMIEEG